MEISNEKKIVLDSSSYLRDDYPYNESGVVWVDGTYTYYVVKKFPYSP